MGVEVKLTLPSLSDLEIEMRTAIRRALTEAGLKLLAISDGLAPTEPDPKHGVHMVDTGFVRVVPGTESDTVVIGYGAFWAVFQHEHLDWEHPHGGEAKFLEKALVGGVDVVMETLREALAEAFG